MQNLSYYATDIQTQSRGIFKQAWCHDKKDSYKAPKK
jgi:hypothetical protein